MGFAYKGAIYMKCGGIMESLVRFCHKMRNGVRRIANIRMRVCVYMCVYVVLPLFLLFFVGRKYYEF